jgi:hypothetical protein
MANWYVRSTFANFVVFWYIFTRLGDLRLEKSGNPGGNASSLMYIRLTLQRPVLKTKRVCFFLPRSCHNHASLLSLSD